DSDSAYLSVQAHFGIGLDCPVTFCWGDANPYAPLTVKHIASMIARSEVEFALLRDMTCGKEVLIESNIERQAIGHPLSRSLTRRSPVVTSPSRRHAPSSSDSVVRTKRLAANYPNRDHCLAA
ncbi:MAG: hypothetical protein OXH52_17735, partial [Gammaproteobacteria bacterium]|nr:hypothetical protein [Gammaproteobacteria bacterium]